MRCEEFQSDVGGLARGALSDARKRDAAAAHEESCEPCASRLADERALTAGLRALASSMSDASAPARAEASLLSAFRSRAAAAASAEGVAGAVSASRAPSNVVSMSEHADARQLSWVKTVAVAALAAAAAVALFMLVPPYTSGPVSPRESAAKNTKNVQSAPVQNNASPTSVGRKEAAQSGEARHASVSEGEDYAAQKLTDENVAAGAPTPKRNVVRATNASYNSPRGGVTPNRNRASEAADAGEITTEFIPLAGFAQSEGVHLVRVELPRSALSSFGIPVNADRAGGRVKADVLLGEDGTARAIRFVR